MAEASEGQPDGESVPPPLAQHQQGLALLACACLLLAAFTNCSLTGLVFLTAFGVWGGICAAHDPRRDGDCGGAHLRHRVAAKFWSFVAALAGIALAAQVLAVRFGDVSIPPTDANVRGT